MGIVTTVTQKGQITLPQTLRKQIGIHKLASVRIEAAEDHLKVYPVEDITDLAGSFVPLSQRSILQARAAIEEQYAEPEEE